MYREISEELLEFLQKSPTTFHAVENEGKYPNRLSAPNLEEPSARKVAVKKYRLSYE